VQYLCVLCGKTKSLIFNCNWFFAKTLRNLFFYLIMIVEKLGRLAAAGKGIEYYYNGKSLRSRLLRLILRVVNIKGREGKPGFAQQIKKVDVPQPPTKFLKDIPLTHKDVLGRKVYTLTPKNIVPEKHILFFHSGAYVMNFSYFHWKLMAKLVRQTGCRITAPDYPLLPDYIYKERLQQGERLYRDLLKHIAPENIILMGDSAGGNLALSLAQKMAADGRPPTGQIILLSPWLDVSMSNSEMKEIDKRDPILSLNENELGQMHAGDRDMKDYLVSPLYIDISDLGRISIFTGTDDILNADARLFKEKAAATGININYFEYRNMVHDWILFPIPEADMALKQVVGLLG
jgi:monoterpene epsilon-lactone hydrolase